MDDKKVNIEDDIEELYIDEHPRFKVSDTSKNNSLKKDVNSNRNDSFVNTFDVNKNNSDMLKKRLQSSQIKNRYHSIINRNNRVEDETEEKSTKDEVQEKVASKAVSMAAQTQGIPKPIADVAGDMVAEPLMKFSKKAKRRMVIAILSSIFVIIIPILCIASDEDFQTANSEKRSEYLYGSGSEEDLYKYLKELGLCNNVESCASTDAAAFYKKLKAVLDSNPYLTKKQADVFITKMIFYKRDEEVAYKQIEEIEYIANIIGKDKSFDISNSDDYKEEFIKEDGYFNIYRKEDLLNIYNTREYKEKIYNEVIKNCKNLISKFPEDKKQSGLVCSYDVNGKKPSNIKVRLLQCADDTRGEPIEGEELVDFEKYLLGVVYAENGGGPIEALKTQAIAARTYSLLRGDSMGGAVNLGLEQENGQWILSLRNCTEDQVYCDPDKGCWSNSSTAGGTVHSGYDSSKNYAKAPLSQDSPIRKAVAETAGKVLVDSNGKMINTPYTNTQQMYWNEMANTGKDHFELLKLTYPDAAKILATCSSASITGDYSSWKQCGQPWSSIRLGYSSSDICDAGCYVTSIAIQMAASGTPINSEAFNPGVLVQHLNMNNAFEMDGSLRSFSWSKLAPSFKSYTSLELTGTKSQKAAIIKSYQDQGYYVIIRAKTRQHWVALDRVEGDEVYMFDPASTATKLWEKYPDYDVTKITIFKNES